MEAMFLCSAGLIRRSLIFLELSTNNRDFNNSPVFRTEDITPHLSLLLWAPIWTKWDKLGHSYGLSGQGILGFFALVTFPDGKKAHK